MDCNGYSSGCVAELLIKQYEKYPSLDPCDIFKYIFQSAFGCEHLVSCDEAAAISIEREHEMLPKSEGPLVEKLIGEYSRHHLASLDSGLTPRTLARLFCLSAKKEQNGRERLEEYISVASELVLNGKLPIDKSAFFAELEGWRTKGYPALHHSDAFRKAYTPSYRVVADKYADFLPIFARIDTLSAKGSVILAIEGGSASGKTTLASILSEVYDANVFHVDDFFLRPEQRTPERLSEVGGNVDRERFYEEVVKPLKVGEAVSYRRFNCSTATLDEPISVEPKRITVVEGVYSAHPAFSRYYDFALLLDIDGTLQRKRILKRNSPELAERFFNEWIPLENKYFSATGIKERVDFIVSVNEKNSF